MKTKKKVVKKKVVKKKATKKKATKKKATKKKKEPPTPFRTVEEMVGAVISLCSYKTRINALDERYKALVARMKPTLRKGCIKAIGLRAMGTTLVARLVPTERYQFSVDKLRELLSPKEFARLCPPTPNVAALRKLVEAHPKTQKSSELAACAKIVPGESLVVGDEKRVMGENCEWGDDTLLIDHFE